MLDMRLHQKVRNACRSRGWDVSQLRAEFPDKSKQTIYNWWNGETKPDLDSALTLARLLGLPLDFLADDEQDTPPVPALSEDERVILRVVRAKRIDADEAIRRLTGDGDGEAGQGAKPQPKGPPPPPPTVPLLPKVPKETWGAADAAGEQELDLGPAIEDLRREKEERKRKGPGGKGPKGEG